MKSRILVMCGVLALLVASPARAQTTTTEPPPPTTGPTTEPPPPTPTTARVDPLVEPPPLPVPPRGIKVSQSEYTDGELTGPTDRDEYPVALAAGESYAVGGYSDFPGLVELIDPSRRLIASFATGPDADKGREFQARITGTYTLRIRATPTGSQVLEDLGYFVWVHPDCFGGLTSRCRLRANVWQPRSWAFNTDSDWIVVDLRGGRRHVFTARSPDYIPVVEIRDAQEGTSLARCRNVRPPRGYRGFACELSYTPRQSGRFFLSITPRGGIFSTRYETLLTVR